MDYMKAEKHIMSYSTYTKLMNKENFSVSCCNCGMIINRKGEYVSRSKHNCGLNLYRIYCVECAKELIII